MIWKFFCLLTLTQVCHQTHRESKMLHVRHVEKIQILLKNNNKTLGIPKVSHRKKNLPGPSFDLMEIPELPYTVPRVVKGRSITRVSVGITMEKEVAKQSW